MCHSDQQATNKISQTLSAPNHTKMFSRVFEFRSFSSFEKCEKCLCVVLLLRLLLLLLLLLPIRRILTKQIMPQLIDTYIFDGPMPKIIINKSVVNGKLRNINEIIVLNTSNKKNKNHKSPWRMISWMINVFCLHHQLRAWSFFCVTSFGDYVSSLEINADVYEREVCLALISHKRCWRMHRKMTGGSVWPTEGRVHHEFELEPLRCCLIETNTPKQSEPEAWEKYIVRNSTKRIIFYRTHYSIKRLNLFAFTPKPYRCRTRV